METDHALTYMKQVVVVVHGFYWTALAKNNDFHLEGKCINVKCINVGNTTDSSKDSKKSGITFLVRYCKTYICCARCFNFKQFRISIHAV